MVFIFYMRIYRIRFVGDGKWGVSPNDSPPEDALAREDERFAKLGRFLRIFMHKCLMYSSVVGIMHRTISESPHHMMNVVPEHEHYNHALRHG